MTDTHEQKTEKPKPHHILEQYRLRDALPMWVIYRPSTQDYPGLWVARMHLSLPTHQPTNLVITGKTLETVRRQLPLGLTNIGRQTQDDPVIEEVWL